MNIIKATWPVNSQAEQKVVAFTTTRLDGFSKGAYDSFNMGLHVGDDGSNVLSNRAKLHKHCGVSKAQWLDQIHGTDCVKASGNSLVHQADACWTDESDLACIVMTADCLPVAFRQGNHIAVAHAGWRGLLSGVLENTLSALGGDISITDIWLGPAIGAKAFEVGEEVRELFVAANSESHIAFVPSVNKGKWLADLYMLATIRLVSAGVSSKRVYGGEYCTFTDSERFYSYRRESKTGRMATIIYRQ